MLINLLLIVSLTLGLVNQGSREGQLSPGLKVSDLNGRELSPLNMDGELGAVFFFISGDCPISNRYSPEISRIARLYQKNKLRFYLVYVDESLDRNAIGQHLKDYSMEAIPALHDRKQLLVKAIGATVTPEAAIVSSDHRLIYRGRIDNRFEALGKERRQVTAHDLTDAIDAIIAGKPPVTARTNAIGCYINPVSQ